MLVGAVVGLVLAGVLISNWGAITGPRDSPTPTLVPAQTTAPPPTGTVQINPPAPGAIPPATVSPQAPTAPEWTVRGIVSGGPPGAAVVAVSGTAVDTLCGVGRIGSDSSYSARVAGGAACRSLTFTVNCRPAEANPPVATPTPVTNLTLAAGAAPIAASLNIAGRWDLTDTATSGVDQGRLRFRLTLTQSGTYVTGSTQAFELYGALCARTLSATYGSAGGLFHWTFSLDGRSFSGGFTADINGGESAGTFVGR